MFLQAYPPASFADNGQIWHEAVYLWFTVTLRPTCQISSRRFIVSPLSGKNILLHFQFHHSVVASRSGAEITLNVGARLQIFLSDIIKIFSEFKHLPGDHAFTNFTVQKHDVCLLTKNTGRVATCIRNLNLGTLVVLPLTLTPLEALRFCAI